MSIPAKSKVYLVTYPATLPKEGIVPVEERIEALTNYISILGFVDSEEDGVKERGWEVKDIGNMTAEEAIDEYNIKDGEPVEIEEGDEWQCDEKGRWATPGRTSYYAELNRISWTNTWSSTGKN